MAPSFLDDLYKGDAGTPPRYLSLPGIAQRQTVLDLPALKMTTQIATDEFSAGLRSDLHQRDRGIQVAFRLAEVTKRLKNDGAREERIKS